MPFRFDHTMKITPTLLLSAVIAGCTSTPANQPAVQLPPVTLEMPTEQGTTGMASDLGARLDSILSAAMAEGAAPGAAIAVGRWDKVVHLRAYGRIDAPSNAALVADSTLFDLASLTKVIATTTAAMILEDEGKLDLDAPIRTYLPELDAPDKSSITTRMLLTHTGGFEAFAPLWRDTRGRAGFLGQINTRKLAYAP